MKIVLVTGATGLVGSHVAETLVRQGVRVRAFARRTSPAQEFLTALGVEILHGELGDTPSFARAMTDVTHVVHCAAQVGDWGPADAYQRVNCDSLTGLIEAARRSASLERFVMMSSLGVYEARDHRGTDEAVPACLAGLDPYTRSKALSEQQVCAAAKAGLPAVILRPGFVYGPRDRQVMPRLVDAIERGRFVYFGSGQQLLNNTAARNIAHAARLALTADVAPGEIFNITDAPLATRRQFVGTVAGALRIEAPDRSLPLAIARPLAMAMDRGARLLRRETPPLLSMARYKFLALHLEYSIDKSRRVLGYQPVIGYEEGVAEAVEWLLRGRSAAGPGSR